LALNIIFIICYSNGKRTLIQNGITK